MKILKIYSIIMITLDLILTIKSEIKKGDIAMVITALVLLLPLLIFVITC